MASQKNHILVPVDFSEQSLIALSQSYNLARLTKAEITLIYVIDDDENNPLFFFLKSKKQNKKALEKNIKEKLSEVASSTHLKSGVKTNTMVAYGKIYDEINAAAKKLKCSFVIMGTNGTPGFKRFIGSNALRVIREAPCPVITIKGKKHRPGCKNILLPLDVSKETREKV